MTTSVRPEVSSDAGMSERAKALVEAAEYAEFYAHERLALCGDSILFDPVLRAGFAGGPFTRAELQKSREVQTEGTINSAAYHAALAIAEHLRALATADQREVTATGREADPGRPKEPPK